MNWEEINERCYRLLDDDWTVDLKIDDSGACLEIYHLTSLTKVANWGAGVALQRNSEEWCKKQAIIIFEQEKKKRG